MHCRGDLSFAKLGHSCFAKTLTIWMRLLPYLVPRLRLLWRLFFCPRRLKPYYFFHYCCHGCTKFQPRTFQPKLQPQVFLNTKLFNHRPLRDHPFKTLANFHKFLTPTPLPSAVFLVLSVGKIFDPSP